MKIQRTLRSYMSLLLLLLHLLWCHMAHSLCIWRASRHRLATHLRLHGHARPGMLSAHASWTHSSSARLHAHHGAGLANMWSA